MEYKVIITSFAKHQLEMYIAYTLYKIKNLQAARAIRDDAKRTKKRLSNVAGSLSYCENEILARNGYRRILFDKHDFFMVYRIEGNTVIVDAMYHKLQDYESVFCLKDATKIICLVYNKVRSTYELDALFAFTFIFERTLQ